MTVLNGYIIKTGEVVGLNNPNITELLSSYALDVWPPHSSLASKTPKGSLVTSWPVEANPTSREGSVAGSYFQDYYNRIHIIPSALALGNVVSNQTRNVGVWNAFLVNQLVSLVTYPPGVGLAITEPEVTPFMLAALREINYVVSISTIGPPNIDLDIIFAIGGKNYALHMTGRRIIVWSFEPDWQGDVNEILTWLTDIFVARSGDEQRESVRSAPRRTLEYSLSAVKDQAATLQNLLFGWQNRTFAMPIWFDNTELTSDAAIGSDVIACVTTDRGFFISGLVLIIQDYANYEVREILAFTSSTIKLTNALEKNWSKTTRVYPMNTGRFPLQMQSTRLTDSVLTMQVSFDVDPIQNDVYIPVGSASLIYAGYEMIENAPNWSDPVTLENIYESSISDYQTGGIFTMPTHEFPNIMRTFSWLFKNKTELIELRKLLGRLKGQVKAVYIPTWFSDFQLYLNETALSTTLRVMDNEFYKMVGLNAALNVIAITTVGNPTVYRKITSMTLNAGYVSLGLDGAVGYILNSTTLVKLSLVHLCRMSSDRATIKYVSNNVGVMQASFVLVRA